MASYEGAQSASAVVLVLGSASGPCCKVSHLRPRGQDSPGREPGAGSWRGCPTRPPRTLASLVPHPHPTVTTGRSRGGESEPPALLQALPLESLRLTPAVMSSGTCAGRIPSGGDDPDSALCLSPPSTGHSPTCVPLAPSAPVLPMRCSVLMDMEPPGGRIQFSPPDCS